MQETERPEVNETPEPQTLPEVPPRPPEDEADSGDQDDEVLAGVRHLPPPLDPI